MYPDDDLILSPTELIKAVEIIKDKLAFFPEDRSFRRFLMYLSDEQMEDPELVNISKIATNLEERYFMLWLGSHFGFKN